MLFDISEKGLNKLGMDREEFENSYETCESCQGSGGDDWSRDIEEYDDWHNCEYCEGQGFVSIERNF